MFLERPILTIFVDLVPLQHPPQLTKDSNSLRFGIGKELQFLIPVPVETCVGLNE